MAIQQIIQIYLILPKRKKKTLNKISNKIYEISIQNIEVYKKELKDKSDIIEKIIAQFKNTNIKDYINEFGINTQNIKKSLLKAKEYQDIEQFYANLFRLFTRYENKVSINIK